MKTVKSLSAAALALVILASCSTTPAKKEITPVQYDGVTSFVPATGNSVSDTVITLDSIPFRVTEIHRYSSPATDFTISMNIDVPQNNDNIAGALASYAGEVVSSFTPNRLSDPAFLGVDSVAPMSVRHVVHYADSLVEYFNTIMVPQAMGDSVVGTAIDITVKPVYADKKYVTYAMYSSSYMGGAHSEADFFLQSYDAATGAPLSFYSLIPPAKQQQVRQELVERIAKEKSQTLDQYLASVNEWAGTSRIDSWTVDNFPIYHVGISAQGYVFCYPKYSIAPGSEGVGVFVVPIG